MHSMADIISQHVLSYGMAKKVAQSGLRWEHVVKAHERDHENGVHQLFTERDGNGKLRVTASKKIISKVNEFIRGNV